jgi:hypothetical protein
MRVETVLAALLLGACANALATVSPRVSKLEIAPAQGVPVSCPITIAFHAESQADLVQAKVTWRVTQHVGKRHLVNHWYAILPIPQSFPNKTEGVVALQLRPQREGTYSYVVEVEDVAGRKSNVLRKTVMVTPHPAGLDCPPADPGDPSRS